MAKTTHQEKKTTTTPCAPLPSGAGDIVEKARAAAKDVADAASKAPASGRCFVLVGFGLALAWSWFWFGVGSYDVGFLDRPHHAQTFPNAENEKDARADMQNHAN